MSHVSDDKQISNSSKILTKGKHPFDRFGTASEIYTDMDALRDSIILKIKIFFGQAAKPEPIESYRERFRVDKKTATRMRESTNFDTHDHL